MKSEARTAQRATLEMKSYLSLLTSFYFHLILILLYQGHSKLACNVSPPRTILATLGDNAELPCFFTISPGKAHSFRIKWVKYTPGMTQPKDILSWPPFTSLPNYKCDEDSLMLGNLSLTLKNVNMTDSGLYGCFAWDGWVCVMARNVTLKVKDCVTLESILAPTNGTAKLPCTFPNTSVDTQRVNITWMLVLAEKHPFLLQYPPSSEQSIRGRVRFKMDPRSGDASLIVSNLTHADRNWYRCHLILGQTSQCFEMKLEVQDFVSEETATFGTSTVTLKQRNITNEQYSSKSAGTGTIVAIAVLSAFFCIFMVSVGSAFYIKQCRSSPDTTDEDSLQEAYYSNVDFRNSAHVLNTFYTVTHAANRWSSDHSTDSKTSDDF